MRSTAERKQQPFTDSKQRVCYIIPYKIVKKTQTRDMKSAWAGDGDGEETRLRFIFFGRNFGTLEPGGGARGGSRRGLAGRGGTAAAL